MSILTYFYLRYNFTKEFDNFYCSLSISKTYSTLWAFITRLSAFLQFPGIIFYLRGSAKNWSLGLPHSSYTLFYGINQVSYSVVRVRSWVSIFHRHRMQKAASIFGTSCLSLFDVGTNVARKERKEEFEEGCWVKCSDRSEDDLLCFKKADSVLSGLNHNLEW